MNHRGAGRLGFKPSGREWFRTPEEPVSPTGPSCLRSSPRAFHLRKVQLRIKRADTCRAASEQRNLDGRSENAMAIRKCPDFSFLERFSNPYPPVSASDKSLHALKPSKPTHKVRCRMKTSYIGIHTYPIHYCSSLHLPPCVSLFPISVPLSLSLSLSLSVSLCFAWGL